MILFGECWGTGLLLGCVQSILIGGWYDVELTPILTQLSCGGADEIGTRLFSVCHHDALHWLRA